MKLHLLPPARFRRPFALGSLSAVAVLLLAFAIAAPLLLRSSSGPLAGTPKLQPLLAVAPIGQMVDHRRGGYWHTEGATILDRRNHPVRIAGVNWSGFETRRGVVGGLEEQDYRAILRTIRANGYNTVRIPLSNEMVEGPHIPEQIRFANAKGPMNRDLRDLDSMQILDRIVRYAGKLHLKIILDNHRSEAGDSAEANGLWFTERFPERAWIEDWKLLAARYQHDPTVIGMDLRNEPHNAAKGGACWDCGGARDWHRAAERAGNAILAINPNLLIFVEGVDEYAGDGSWWGGNLAGARRSPVRLDVPGRLVYSPHVYGPTEYPQSWFSEGTTPASLRELWRRQWGFLAERNLAPVWVGEFGTPNTDLDVESAEAGSEGQWFTEFVGYLREHAAIGWTYWGINGEDRYGLLDAQYQAPANERKQGELATIQAPLPSTHSPQLLLASLRLHGTGFPLSRGPVPQPVSYAPAPVSTPATAPERVPERRLPLVDEDTAEPLETAISRGRQTGAVDDAVAENIRNATREALQEADVQRQ